MRLPPRVIRRSFRGTGYSPDPRLSDVRRAARGYLAYSEPFHVDEETRTVHHVTTVSLFPNWVGTDRLRIVRFDSDDGMTLSTPPFDFRETSWNGAAVRRRITPHSGRSFTSLSSNRVENSDPDWSSPRAGRVG
ncbi:lipocalin-like domain-containing protein [Nocardia elegans]|nr:lipocalin-like domain-containing protein [Nocardia elegans]